MAVPLEALTPSDYEILRYINKFDSVSKEQIMKRFKNKIESIEYRLARLSQGDFHEKNHFSMPIPNSSYIIVKDKDNYYISSLGKKVLQDYQKQKKSDSKNLWLKNAWIPIIVAFVTTVITNYIIPKLPAMLQWLANTLSKIF